MKISMIAAVAKNRVIGKDNDLVWHLPDDMKFFKDTTKDHVVIMGRKNFESLPPKWKPLPNRTNLIISRNAGYDALGCKVFTSLENCFDYVKTLNQEEVFIIGGGQIYKLGLELADRMYITEIDAEFDGDAFFPEWDKSMWSEVNRSHHAIDEKHEFAFDFVTYDRT
ncbi:MAG: dihydrofolate reductase [bacterium]|nr:dihydrofolate reductase [bacterium]